MDWITSPDAWIALVTLTSLEIVLGIDNIIFIAILASKLPEHLQSRGRSIGLMLAMVTRIALLFSITLIMRLTQPLFSLFDHAFSGRDLILIVGGLFLLGKSTLEVHENLEGSTPDHQDNKKTKASFLSVIIQIMILDIVFSLDSVITAVGLADDLAVMVIAIIIAVMVMLFMAAPISRFVENHPTIKMLALSFLLLIGVSLIGEGLTLHIPKGYIYFAMAFSLFVELLNIRVRSARSKPVKLRKSSATSLE
ncbi:MAG: TerC family protein [Desulfobulbaceae bacterium]|nr:MAG: TerC family protein [Desulfobulbaceae bacterium]